MKIRFSHLFLILFPILISSCTGQSTAGEDYHPGIGVPKLSLSASQSDIFGNTYVGESNDATITVTNAGTEKASYISGSSLSAPLTYKGGSFPGTGGTCEDSLNPGVSCTIVVSFTPTATVNSSQTLTITYFNYYGGNSKSASMVVSTASSSGSSGSLDTQTFMSDGIIVEDINASSTDIAYGVGIQSDGKIVVAGKSGSDFALARYSSNGELDTTFNSAGKVTTDLYSSTDTGRAVAIQSDGKILVAGGLVLGSGSSENDALAVVRYQTDGSIDTTFDSDGKAYSSGAGASAGVGSGSGSGNICEATSIALQSDNKIVIAGYNKTFGSIYTFSVQRYNTDGSLDNTFDSDGVVTTSVAAHDNIAYAVAIQNDGKIVAAGGDSDFVLVRYNTDGSLDNTFDSDGKVTTDINGSVDIIFGMAIQSNGKIVVAGKTYNGSDYDFAVARYSTDGSLDSSFDSDGIATTAIGSGNDIAYAIKIDSNGKIIVGGESVISGSLDFALVRYNSDGSLDTTFNSNGKKTLDYNSSIDRIYAMALQNDGKIVGAGHITQAHSDFSLLRIWP